MNTFFDKSNEFNQAVMDTVQKITDIASDDSLVIPIFTDMHISDIHEHTFQLLLQSLKSICFLKTVDAVISLGDHLSMLGRNIHASNEMIAELLQGIFDRISDTTQAPCYHINGNHDGIGTDFFTEDFWYSIVDRKYDCGMAKRDGNSAYFYVDHDKAGVRLIFLSIPCSSDLDTEFPTPLWKFGEKQLKWLKETALPTARGRDIVLFSHVPIYYSHSGDPTLKLAVWNGTQETQSYIEDLYGRVEDQSDMEKILLSHVENNPGSRIAACIYGHNHEDSSLAPQETTESKQHNLLFHQFEISSLNTKNNITLKKNARLGIAFDILVLTPSKRTLTLIRFGDGQDRKIHY